MDMNILFLTLLDFNSIDERDIYTDLLREFAKHGHNLFAVSPIERRKQQDTYLTEHKNVTILRCGVNAGTAFRKLDCRGIKPASGRRA